MKIFKKKITHRSKILIITILVFTSTIMGIIFLITLINKPNNNIEDIIATYSFDNELIGAQGTSIDFINQENGDLGVGVSEIVGEEDGHNKVLKFGKTANGANHYNIRNFITSRPTSGMITWWWKHKTGDSCLIYLTDDNPNTLTWVILSSNSVKWRNGDSTEMFDGIIDDTWYHFRLEFNVYGNNGQGSFNLWIDNTILASNAKFYEKSNNLYEFRLQIEIKNNGITYFDEITYSSAIYQDNTLEYIYYFSITGISFYLFIILLVIFGYSIFYIVNKKLIKTERKFNFFTSFCISLLTGFSTYISLSFILFIFKLFNFFTVYLTLIIFDILFVGFIVFNKAKSNELRKALITHILNFKEKKKFYLTCFLLIIVVIILQLSFQWDLLTQRKSLIFSDPFLYYEKVSFLLKNQTIQSVDYFYPAGFSSFVAGALLIAPNPTIIFYFLKFGGFFLLTLFLTIIFFLSLKIFKKYYLAFFCSILSLSYFLFIYRINLFLPDSLATFLVLLSLILFTGNLTKNGLYENRRLFIYIGFLLSSVFLVHVITAFFYYILFVVYFIFYTTFFDRKHARFIIKHFSKGIIIAVTLFIPFILYLLSKQINIFDMFVKYYSLVSRSTNQVEAYYPSFKLLYFDIFKVILTGDFLKQYYIHIVYHTLGNFLFISILGYYYSKRGGRKMTILLLCKISFIILFSMYTISFFYLGDSFFVKVYLGRIMITYSPFIIILTTSGIKFIEEKGRISIIYIRKRLRLLRKDIPKFVNISKKLINYILIYFLVIFSVDLMIHNKNLLESRHYQYFYDDETIDQYLFIRETVPENSIILMPNFSNNHYEINRILYDQTLLISKFKFNTTYSEFDLFISNFSIEYFLINKVKVTIDTLEIIYNSTKYELLYETFFYYFYRVIQHL